MAEREPERGGGGGSGMGKKFGPLPVWAWAVLFGGGLGLVWFLRTRSNGPAKADFGASGGSGESEGGDEPTNIVPVNQGLGAEQAQAILDAIKELQGDLSEEEEEEEKPPGKTTLPAPLPGKPPKPPAPKPRPKPPRKPPRRYVTTKKWTKLHTPWQSTLWGIARHYKTPGGWQHLQKINKMHGDPKTHLQPGMKIYLE